VGGVWHFLFSFHDSTLEVLGHSFELSLSSEPLAVELSQMRTWLLPEAEPGAAPDPAT
jgi:hypothetical protein